MRSSHIEPELKTENMTDEKRSEDDAPSGVIIFLYKDVNIIQHLPFYSVLFFVNLF